MPLFCVPKKFVQNFIKKFYKILEILLKICYNIEVMQKKVMKPHNHAEKTGSCGTNKTSGGKIQWQRNTVTSFPKVTQT